MEGWTVQRKKSRKSKSPYDMLKSYRDFTLFNQVVEFVDSLAQRACERWSYYLDNGGYVAPYERETCYPHSRIKEKVNVMVYGSLLRNLVTGRDLFDGGVIQVHFESDEDNSVVECFRSALIEKCKRYIQLHGPDGRLLYHNYRPDLDLDDRYRWERWHEENVCPVRQSSHYGMKHSIKVPKGVFGVDVELVLSSEVVYDMELNRLAVVCRNKTLTVLGEKCPPEELMSNRFYLPLSCNLHPFAEEIWKIAAKAFKRSSLEDSIWPELPPSLYELMPVDDAFHPAFKKVGRVTRISMPLTPFQKQLLKEDRSTAEVWLQPWGGIILNTTKMADCFTLGRDICEHAASLRLGEPTMSLEDIWNRSDDKEVIREVLAAISMYASLPVITCDNSDYCLEPRNLHVSLTFDSVPRYFYVYTARHLMLCPQDRDQFETLAKSIDNKQFSDFISHL